MLITEIEIPEKGKPRYVEKVPQPWGNVKMPKMTKNLKFMRGPEEIHNTLIHKQYGIIVGINYLLYYQYSDLHTINFNLI